MYGKTIAVLATPTISTSIYAAGDAVGGKLTFSGITFNFQSGVVQGAVLIDNDKENAETDLILFNQDFTATADNAPFDPSDADLANCIGHIKLAATDYVSFNDNSVATKTGVGLPFMATGTTLYGQLVTRGTPTYTAVDDLKVRLLVLQD